MLKFLVELFVFYLIYKLVVDLIIPVYRVSRQMREHVARKQQEFNAHQNTVKENTSVREERTDYIDFEEIKD
jgi:cell shape-determining protein MreC